ncbi:hypothetical protein [Arcanobacterium pinnipediorum]|uniref:Uncharacterized protein n=1 Tax=Arcanobacterium pinnipediorum TaxID=1503041 RepID=A0ABY5AI78_9ACTO|nr:hypothetical protein [Arcanobacterium pinnipediorum]USR79922.1 hypothetical protein NG665_02780 [Arcanobacterium pinnipediorum]
MWIALSIVIFVAGSAASVIGLVAFQRRPRQGFVEAYKESVKALRNHRQDDVMADVEHHDIAVADVFSSFTQFEGEAYMSPRELNSAVHELTAVAGVDKVIKVADRFKKEDHAA